MQNSLGNISGIIVGPLTGLIVDRTGHFRWAFAVCAAVTLVGGISWTLFVGRLEPVAWPTKSQAVAAASATTLVRRME